MTLGPLLIGIYVFVFCRFMLWRTFGIPCWLVRNSPSSQRRCSARPHSVSSAATDLNNFGEITGSSLTGSGDWRATRWIVQPAPPSQQVALLDQGIQDLVAAGSLAPGVATALSAQLAAVQQALGSDNNTAASNVLGAFINALSAMLRTGRLTDAEATSLIAGAGRVVNQLGGGT